MQVSADHVAAPYALPAAVPVIAAAFEHAAERALIGA